MCCPGFIKRFRLSDRAFTRQRDLPFHRLVSFMLNLRKGSTEQELDGFFATLEERSVPNASPTRAAFSKARKVLSPDVFKTLNRQAIETFGTGWATPLWHGFRLFGVDGATLRLPARLFSALYHRRWSTEESYKRQKRWLEIENISGRSVIAVQQDVHAKILSLNLAAMVRALAQLIATRRFAARKHAYQVRWCSALSVMKNNIVRVLIGDPCHRSDLLERLICRLSSVVDAVRPDRSFQRCNPGQLKPGFHVPYWRAT